MNELKKCEFLLVRYMPDALTEEFVNLGVVLLERGANGNGFAGLRFVRDFRRARCLDPGLDTELFGELESDLRKQLARTDREWLVEKLQDYCSNGIQMTPAKACLTADPVKELESLARIYLERRRPGKRETSGRQAILNQIRSSFEQAGVWDLMSKNIAVSQFTHQGDPLRIDCGYRPNGTMRMFHAVSLRGDIDTAKVLAFSYPEMRDGMARLQSVTPELTAIIEPDIDRGDEAVAFAVAVMRRSEMHVAMTTDLPAIAEQAKRELRA